MVGKISPWIDVDLKDKMNRNNSILAFQQELAFGADLNLPAILFKLKGPENI